MANINRYDDLATGAIAYATLLSCIVLVITILGIRALCSGMVEGEEARKSAGAHYYTSDKTISEQRARLDGYRKETVEVTYIPEGGGDPVTETQTMIRIPVEDAKALVFEAADKKSS
ncbi:MAG: hypothetical protein AAF483_00720 [Planctomycetota bacterium]